MPINSGSTLCAPTTPRTVRVAPDDRCTSMPSSMRRAITESICASVARSFITTTIVLFLDCWTAAAIACCTLGTSRFIDDALEDSHHGFGGEWTGQRGG